MIIRRRLERLNRGASQAGADRDASRRTRTVRVRRVERRPTKAGVAMEYFRMLRSSAVTKLIKLCENEDFSFRSRVCCCRASPHF